MCRGALWPQTGQQGSGNRSMINSPQGAVVICNLHAEDASQTRADKNTGQRQIALFIPLASLSGRRRKQPVQQLVPDAC
jgi:hypothetical protein